MNEQPPRLSVVVAVVSDTVGGRTDTQALRHCLQALESQRAQQSVEIIVATQPRVRGLADAKAAFPGVTWLVVDDLATFREGQSGREHHDELRSRGIAAARGRIVALLEDHEIPAPDWLAQVQAAEWEQYGGIGGAIENGLDTSLSWAVYLCDFRRYQNPVVNGPSAIASDANVAYRRDVLDQIRPVWDPMFREPAVNHAVREAGFGLALSPKIVVFQNRQRLTLRSAIVERYIWGRSFGAHRARTWSGLRRVSSGLLGPALFAILMSRILLDAARQSRTRRGLSRAFPIIGLLTASWSLGEALGYCRGKPVQAGLRVSGSHAEPNQKISTPEATEADNHI